ncbi:hypothetical protein ACFRI7_22755 [Streptomyces sp. NPDC056716]|uniref:hypothetical protein n=1 Tax=unclassified Streptomyces TaxID=2593676 RepID=UPI0036AD2E22
MDLIGHEYADLGALRTRRAIHRAYSEPPDDVEEATLALARSWAGARGTVVDVGCGHQNMGHPQDAVTYYEDSLTAFRRLGDRQWQAYTLRALAGLHASTGETAKADACRTEAADLLAALTGSTAEGRRVRRL